MGHPRTFWSRGEVPPNHLGVKICDSFCSAGRTLRLTGVWSELQCSGRWEKEVPVRFLPCASERERFPGTMHVGFHSTGPFFISLIPSFTIRGGLRILLFFSSPAYRFPVPLCSLRCVEYLLFVDFLLFGPPPMRRDRSLLMFFNNKCF